MAHVEEERARGIQEPRPPLPPLSSAQTKAKGDTMKGKRLMYTDRKRQRLWQVAAGLIFTLCGLIPPVPAQEGAHWIPVEQPQELTRRILAFFGEGQ